MTRETFAEGIAMLCAASDNIRMTEERMNILYDLMQKIPDRDFTDAVRQVCNEVKEIYPGTNIVALIRAQIPPDDGITRI